MTPLQKLSMRVRVTGFSLIASLAVALISMAFASSPAKAGGTFTLTHVLKPGNALDADHLMHTDIGWINKNTGHYLLADRATNAVEAYSPETDSFLYLIQSPNGAGPNGVATDANGVVWYGDNSSHLVAQRDAANDGSSYVCNVNTIASGYTSETSGRADELAVDPKDHIVVIANPDATFDAVARPYLTFVSTRNCEIKKVVEYPNAEYEGTGGIEQSQYSRTTGMFYTAIPYDDDISAGAVWIINPKLMQVESKINVGTCHPNGLALGPYPYALLVCNHDTGADHSVAVVNLQSGSILKKYDTIAGGDEGWYNPGDNHFFAAVNHNTDPGPEIGVIDAANIDTPDDPIPTLKANSSHSVAADPNTLQVFVPYNANSNPGPDHLGPDNVVCTYGCVAVYSETNADLKAQRQMHGFRHQDAN